MKPAEIISTMNTRGVVVTATTDGNIMLDGPAGTIDDDLTDAARRHRWLFTWGLAGATSGHHWHRCDVCSEVQLEARRSRPRRCIITHDCPGYMQTMPEIFGSAYGRSAHVKRAG